MARAADSSQQRLELGEGHLDRIEVGRIGRQEEKPRSRLLDGLAHTANPLGWQVIHDHDVAGAQFRREDLLGIGQQALPFIGPSSNIPERRDRSAATRR